ncbi:MAG: transposase [Phycisphaerae bacterium]
MPRFARVVLPGCVHHVTQRGNNRQDVFFVDDDRRAYLGLLRQEADRHGLRVLGYCLMTNHVHLIAVPRAGDSLARAVGRTHFRYTQYVNRLHGRSGHLWQNRFHSCVLDEPHYWEAMKYIERNAVRARLVRRAWRYAWSSAEAHCDGRDRSGVLDMSAWQRDAAGLDWRAALTQPQDEKVIASLRLCTSRGRPLASDSFVSKLEKRIGRRLRPLPIGRPPKKKRPPVKGRKK